MPACCDSSAPLTWSCLRRSVYMMVTTLRVNKDSDGEADELSVCWASNRILSSTPTSPPPAAAEPTRVSGGSLVSPGPSSPTCPRLPSPPGGHLSSSSCRFVPFVRSPKFDFRFVSQFHTSETRTNNPLRFSGLF